MVDEGHMDEVKEVFRVGVWTRRARFKGRCVRDCVWDTEEDSLGSGAYLEIRNEGVSRRI